ncbi:F-box domain containing protein, partial [Tanacetum coccineum]
MNSVRFPLSLFKFQSLKHLSLTCTIIDDSFESYYRPYALTASPTLELPALTTLYLGNVTMREGFGSLEKVYLGVYSGIVADAPRMFRLLQHLQSVKYLTLSLECVEVLSSSLELFSDQTSPFTTLKMLKIYPEVVHELAQKNVSMSVEVKKFLLNGSPSATFTMVSRQ